MPSEHEADDTIDAGLEETQAAPADAAPARAAAIAPGTSIRQYQLIRELGHGGMGRVYLARDTKLRRRVAIKFLARTSRSVSQRFLVEARTTARLSHENIVVIHEVDEHDGVPYMVLEYLEGSSLAEVIREGPVPPARAVALIVPVLRALERAHAAQVIHRDLKPENIFVTTAGTVKVLDFGISKLLSEVRGPAPDDAAPIRPSDLSATLHGGLVGTIPYMAPEQLGQGTVDHRVDLWACGIVLWELLTGHHPLEPVTTARMLEMASRLDEPMPPASRIAGLPAALATAIDGCLRKRAADRIESAARVLELLEPLAAVQARRARDADSPYPGLVAFQESDAERFHGRRREAERVVARLRDHPMLAIVGPSGIGKSSFIRAGVLPLLRASDVSWDVFTIRPGRSPIAALAHALLATHEDGPDGADPVSDENALATRLRADPAHLATVLRAHALLRRCRVLLFVDQLEELYTLVADPAERRAFTAVLTAAAADPHAAIRVIVAMRSDLLDRIADDRVFVQEVTRGLVFLPPLDPAALREAVTQPAEALGYRFEDGALVDEMLAALATTPGALPLLQFTCGRLWELRDRRSRVLTRESYAAIGGVAGALSTHADDVLAAMSAPQQRLVRLVFARLVTPERTRALADLDELLALPAPAGEMRAVIDRLADARLVVVQTGGDEPQATVELVHESLISAWPTLRRWLDEEQDDAAYLQQLRMAARQWDARGRASGLLWRGDAALEARAWRARYRGELAAGERDFLDAVFALAGRAQRLRLAALASVAGFLLIVVVVGGIALVSIRRAEQDAREQMVRAQHEAGRARDAEVRVQEQLDLLRAEKTARAEAQADATRARGTVEEREAQLERSNAELAAALATARAAQARVEQEGRRAAEQQARAEVESSRARAAAAKAENEAVALERANARLEQLLAKERERAEKAERERRKISTELAQ